MTDKSIEMCCLTWPWDWGDATVLNGYATMTMTLWTTDICLIALHVSGNNNNNNARYIRRHTCDEHSQTGRSSSQPSSDQQEHQVQSAIPCVRSGGHCDRGTWHRQAVELVQEIGRRTANITGDARESTFLFQQLSVALQRGNAVSFQNTFTVS